MKALGRDELITNPDKDSRKFSGKIFDLNSLKGKMVVIKESKKGKNLLYFDMDKLIIISKADFLIDIQNGNYPRYEIRNINGEETPVSKKDKLIPNNLG